MSLAILLAVCLAAPVSPDVKEKAEITLRETFAFDPGGVIEITGSFGDLRVEGWDRPDVEVTTTRTTRRGYATHEQSKAREELDRVAITPAKLGPGRFLISTRPLRGKSNIEIEYRIKVPRNSNLVIKHDIGEVAVSGVSGNLDVASHIGEVTLRLPDTDQFRVDARCRIGDVHSDFETDSPGDLHSVLVRVGIGEINIRRVHARTEPVRAPVLFTL